MTDIVNKCRLISEHIRAAYNPRSYPNNSIGKRFAECHVYCASNLLFTILDKQSSTARRKISEAILLSKHEPKSNAWEELWNSSYIELEVLYWSIYVYCENFKFYKTQWCVLYRTSYNLFSTERAHFDFSSQAMISTLTSSIPYRLRSLLILKAAKFAI